MKNMPATMAIAARPPTTPPAIAPVLELLLELPLLPESDVDDVVPLAEPVVVVLNVSSFSRPASLKPPEGASLVAPPLPL